MPETAPRRFALVDLMALVAASAVAIAWTIAAHGEALTDPAELDWKIRLRQWIGATHPALHSLGVTLLLCHLRSPRPPLRLLARRPGFVASAATALTLLADAATELIARALKPAVLAILPPSRVPSLAVGSASMPLSFDLSMIDPGPAVALGWLLLAALALWRPEPSWVDRLGRVLGACWITVHVAGDAVYVLIMG